MKKIAAFSIFLFWLVGNMVGGASAQEPRLTASFDRTRATIGDRITLILDVDAPEGSEIAFPDLKTHLGGLTLKTSGEEKPKPLQNGWVRRSLWAVLTAYEVKPYGVAPIPVAVRLPSGDKVTLQTLPLFVEVASVLKEGETMTDIRDIKGPVSLPGLRLGRRAWSVLCLLGFLLIGIFLWLRGKARPKPVPALAPHLAALQALDRIEAMGLDQKDVKEYYFLVSGILRRYLEDRFGLRAPEQTTEEFLGVVINNHLLQEAQKTLLKSFLEHCDLVKFAKYAPKREEAAWIFKTARDFIDRTKPNV